MKRVIVLTSLLLLGACSANYQGSVPSTLDKELTVGVVQREIRPGMAQADVAIALGSPNIVTKDGSGKETWVYDKIASEASYTSSHTGAGIAGGVAAMAGSVLLLGIPSVNFDTSSSHQQTSERTLTVVIKFDSRNLVSDATYHASHF